MSPEDHQRGKIVHALQERAKREGGNAVINIKSVYKNENVENNTEYLCGAGTHPVCAPECALDHGTRARDQDGCFPSARSSGEAARWLVRDGRVPGPLSRRYLALHSGQ